MTPTAGSTTGAAAPEAEAAAEAPATVPPGAELLDLEEYLPPMDAEVGLARVMGITVDWMG